MKMFITFTFLKVNYMKSEFIVRFYDKLEYESMCQITFMKGDINYTVFDTLKKAQKFADSIRGSSLFISIHEIKVEE